MTHKEIVNELNRLAQEVENSIMPPQEWDTPSLLARLKEASNGVTLQELSGRSGINISNLSLILNGNRIPRLDTFLAIAQALGMELKFDNSAKFAQASTPEATGED